MPSHVTLQSLHNPDDSVARAVDALNPQYNLAADGVGFGFRYEVVATNEMPESLRLLVLSLIAAKHAELRALVLVNFACFCVERRHEKKNILNTLAIVLCLFVFVVYIYSRQVISIARQ